MDLKPRQVNYFFLRCHESVIDLVFRLSSSGGDGSCFNVVAAEMDCLEWLPDLCSSDIEPNDVSSELAKDNGSL